MARSRFRFITACIALCAAAMTSFTTAIASAGRGVADFVDRLFDFGDAAELFVAAVRETWGGTRVASAMAGTGIAPDLYQRNRHEAHSAQRGAYRAI